MIIFRLFALVFGLFIGSFLNVVIYRTPRDQSIVSPRSSCPACGKLISWYENIPIFSFLFLRGHCSGCKARISWRYPAVELVVGIAAAACFTGVTGAALLNFVFFFSVFCVFLAELLIDLEHQILPDGLNLYLAIMFLVFALIYRTPIYWISGALIGFLFPYSVTWVFYKLRGKIGLGGGDIKLFGALGLWLGPIGIVQNIFLSCFSGALVGLLFISLKKMTKDNPIPFGPFILIVAAVQIFFPELFEKMTLFRIF